MFHRLETLDATSITEKTLNRLRRVIEHAGPSFSLTHFNSLMSTKPLAASFGPLCEYVLTAFDIAQHLYEQKWRKLGLNDTKTNEIDGVGGNVDGNATTNGHQLVNGNALPDLSAFDSSNGIGDAELRSRAREAMREQREAEDAKKKADIMELKAEQEWKEAIDAEKEAEQALAVAVLAKEDARLSMVAAEKELQDVQTVRTKIEEEGGNDVLLRSLLREQKEAMEAQENAQMKINKANVLEQEASIQLKRAKKEKAEALRATKKALKYEKKAEKEMLEAQEARELTKKAIVEMADEQKIKKNVLIQREKAVEQGLIAEKVQKEKEIRMKQETIERRTKHRQDMDSDRHAHPGLLSSLPTTLSTPLVYLLGGQKSMNMPIVIQQN